VKNVAPLGMFRAETIKGDMIKLPMNFLNPTQIVEENSMAALVFDET